MVRGPTAFAWTGFSSFYLHHAYIHCALCSLSVQPDTCSRCFIAIEIQVLTEGLRSAMAADHSPGGPSSSSNKIHNHPNIFEKAIFRCNFGLCVYGTLVQLLSETKLCGSLQSSKGALKSNKTCRYKMEDIRVEKADSSKPEAEQCRGSENTQTLQVSEKDRKINPLQSPSEKLCRQFPTAAVQEEMSSAQIFIKRLCPSQTSVTSCWRWLV